MGNQQVEDNKNKLQKIVDAIIQDPSIDKNAKAKVIIHATALICAIVAVQPIPFADIFVLSPIQLVMVTALNKVLGNPYQKSSLKEVLTSLLGVVGWGTMAQHIILGLYKSVLPFMGGLTTIPLVYAATFALGCGAKVLIESKKNQQNISDEALKAAFQKAKAEASAEQKRLTMTEALEQINTLLKDADNYNLYKNQLLSLDRKINSTFSPETDMNTDLSKLFTRRKTLIVNRIKNKYKNIKAGNYIYNLLTVLDGKIFTEVAEPIISQINYNLAGMDCVKSSPSKKGTFFEINTELGMILVNRQNKYEILSIQFAEAYTDNPFIPYMTSKVSENTTLLQDAQIKERFHWMIKNAKKYIYIISPWVGSYPYKTVASLMQEAVAQNPNLKIKVIYGMKDFSSSSQARENKRLEESRTYVKKYQEQLGTAFSFKESNTHVKLVICDDECYLLGSMNVLSFDADYEGKATEQLHHEVSLFSQDKDMLLQLKEAYFNW